MYEARQNKEKVSRRIEGDGSGARQKEKMWQAPIACKTSRSHIYQFARVANINCPNWGDNASLGNTIHSFIQTRFLVNNIMNNARVEILHRTPFWHRHDIGDINNRVYRYGEIKPNTQGGINAGMQQIRHHSLGKRIIVNNLANLQFPLSNIDPHASIIGNQNPNPTLRIQQPNAGLLVYDGQ